MRVNSIRPISFIIVATECFRSRVSESLARRLRVLRASVLPNLLVAFAFILLAGVFATNSASAKEPYAKFSPRFGRERLERRRARVYRADRKAPRSAGGGRETLDLERSNCLRAAAQNAYDAQQSEQLLADAQKYLDKFLASHPNHPAAANSILMWGDSLFELGQRSLAAARRAADQAQKTKLFAEARDYFKQAGGRYGEAQDRFLARYAQLAPDKAASDDRTSQKVPRFPRSGKRRNAAPCRRVSSWAS